VSRSPSALLRRIPALIVLRRKLDLEDRGLDLKAKPRLEDSLMYRHMTTPGVKYVIAKIERSVWGWNHEQSLKHADWIAGVCLIPYAEELLSVAQRKFAGKTVIAGLYLNSGTESRWLTEGGSST
jgi:hypothetical protein